MGQDMSKRVLFFLLFLPLPSMVQSAVFKCVENNKTVYAQMPCSKDARLLETDSLITTTQGAFSVAYSSGSGGYIVPAAINGVSVHGLLDTGATNTTISGAVAHRLGIETCEATGFAATAAGKVAVCRLTNIRLSFGGFVFAPISVLVIPAMPQDMLIGQDLLSRVQVTQKNGVMTLSR